MKLGFKIIISILLIGLLIGGVQATNSFLPFNNNFNDNSGRVWTLTGVVPFSTTIFKYGGSSANWSNNTGGNYLYSNASGTTYTNFNTSPFTIDWYFYRTENSNSGYSMVFMKTVDDNWNTGYGFYRHTGFGAGTYRFYWGDYSHYTSVFIPLDTWTHIAVIGNGTYTKLYLNGNYTTQLATSANVDIASPFTIGGEYGYSSYTSGGYINDFNITAGSEVWTSNFTPPVYGPTSSITSNFNANPPSGVAPLTVAFTDTSTTASAIIDSWSWIFGDLIAGNTSTSQNPSHTYISPGTYTANLTIQNTTLGLTSTKLQTIYANSTLIVDFSATPTYGFASQPVQFNDLSTGDSPNNWLWNFGDGDATNSTKQNPLHTYSNAGNYSVSLTVSGPDGTNSTTKINYIAIDWKIFSGFTASNTAPIAYEQTVLFTLNVPNTADRYQWSFGDGSTFLSYNNSVEHMYTTTGGKTVSLTAYRSENTSISNTTTRINYINPVYSASLVIADFSGSPTSGSAGVAVMFTDLSVFGTNTGKTYNWSFGDSTYSSIVGDVTHVYGNYGTYTVTLVVNNTIGNSSITKTNYITVSTQTTNLVYSAQLYRLVFQNLIGTPLGGLSVEITPTNLTMPSAWTSQLIGISPQVNITNGVIFGKTAADGTLGVPLLTSLGYSIHVYGTATSGDIVDYTIPEYPPSGGTDIVISLPTSVIGFITIKPTPSTITYNIYNQSISNTTNILSVNYNDPACTTNLTIVTVRNQSGYILNTTTYTGTSSCNIADNITYIQGVTSPPGDIIQYGLSAYVPNGGGWNNITETVGFNNGSSITGNATYDSWLAIILIVLISSAFTASTIYIGTIGVGLMGLFFYLSTKWFTPGVAGTTFVGLCVFWICIGAIGLITKRSRSVF